MQQQEKEFERFYRKYFKLAMFSAINFTNKVQDSQELVDDCFLGLWRAWGKLDTEESRLKYLQASVKNRCINLTEKKQKLKLEFKIDEVENQWNYAEIHAFIINTIMQQMDEHISRLPTRRRQIMRMIVDGSSTTEIALRLGIAEKTVHAVKNLCMPALIKIALR